MTTEELIIERVRELDLEQQRQVWDFISTLPKREFSENSPQVKFEHHFGALSLKDTTYIDNESIDADLANEYANAHEVE